MVFIIPRRGLSPIFVEINASDPYEVEIIKKVDTNIIIDPLYLDNPEDLYVLAYMMGKRPWDILCEDVDMYSKVIGGTGDGAKKDRKTKR